MTDDEIELLRTLEHNQEILIRQSAFNFNLSMKEFKNVHTYSFECKNCNHEWDEGYIIVNVLSSINDECPSCCCRIKGELL